MSEAASLGRSSGVMALGTLASRATGFLRVIALAAAIGLGPVSVAYNVANTAPNIVYELLLGGVLTSVVVPLLVQAAREDEDGGVGLAQLLLTLVTVVLGVAALLGVLGAPLLARLFLGDDGPKRELATTFLRYFLPQIVFYGIGATATAILNTRRRFGVSMAAPVLNNLVVIATCVVFTLLPDAPPGPDSVVLTGAQTTVLGVGTTLGVVVMTLALLPDLRRSGFRWRWRLGSHPALRRAVRLGAWVVVYVVANQLAYVVIVHLADAADFRSGVTAYQTAFILFQLPHAVVTVSVVTALVPQLATDAVDGALDRLRAGISQGMRLVGVILLPAALCLVAIAQPLAQLVLDHGAAVSTDARFVGSVLTAFACGLLSFSAFQLLLRVFYALQDSRTPALVNIGCSVVNIAADLVLFTVLDGRDRVVGLAVGHALAYTVGVAVFARLLSRRLDGIDWYTVIRTLVRAGLAAVIAAIGAWGAARLAVAWLGGGAAGAAGAVAAAVVVAVPLYVVSARRMELHELDAVVHGVRSRLGR